MHDVSKIHKPIRRRTPAAATRSQDATPRMGNAGLAALVSLGYADAGRNDAEIVYAAMAAADERNEQGLEDDFAELRTALSKASRAPWRHDPDHQMMIGSRHALVRGTGQSAIFGVVQKGYDDKSAADAAFAALARNHLPALLAAYDALRAIPGECDPSSDEDGPA